MKFLLDTHAFLWFINGDEQLPSVARQLIADIDNEIFLSVASLWEIAIKFSLGKLTLGKPFHEIILGQLEINDFAMLPIDIDALNLVSNLPFHHRDPFDRMIIAQAMAEEMAVISKDTIFTNYSIKLIWKNQPEQD